MIPVNDLKAHYFDIKKDIDKAVAEVLASGRYVKGPKVEAFEEKWAERCGYKYAVGVSSGATALELSLQVLPIKINDYNKETFIAIPNAIKRMGGNPTPSSKALQPLLYAHHHHWEALTYRPLLEDCAHCHGCKPIGEIAIFSFFPAKILGAMGDAGILLTNDRDYYELAKELRSHGEGGTNARMDEMQAAILLAKLPYLNEWIGKRQRIVDMYDRAFGKKTLGKYHCYYVLNHEPKIRGIIETGLKYSESEIAIPFYPEMSDEQIKEVIKCVLG